jgi:hypothetical protein
MTTKFPFGSVLESADLRQPVAPPSTATGWFYSGVRT